MHYNLLLRNLNPFLSFNLGFHDLRADKRVDLAVGARLAKSPQIWRLAPIGEPGRFSELVDHVTIRRDDAEDAILIRVALHAREFRAAHWFVHDRGLLVEPVVFEATSDLNAPVTIQRVQRFGKTVFSMRDGFAIGTVEPSDPRNIINIDNNCVTPLGA